MRLISEFPNMIKLLKKLLNKLNTINKN